MFEFHVGLWSDNVQIALMDVLALYKVTCYILAIVNYSVG